MGNYLYNLTYGITNTYITSITNPLTTLSNLTIDNSDGFIINIFVKFVTADIVPLNSVLDVFILIEVAEPFHSN